MISIVPKNIKPDTSVLGPRGRANPLRHWRKQLNAPQSLHSKQISIDALDAPGGSMINPYKCDCMESSNTLAIYTEISKPKLCPCPPIIKSANTNVSKKYYQNSSSYLKSRRKTYVQNNGKGDTQCCNTTVYKPNNPKHSQEGAVSSGSRLERLKLDTIQKNAASLKSSYGRGAANAASYKGDFKAPQIVKTNNYVEKCC